MATQADLDRWTREHGLPGQKPIDYLTRIDELLIENIKAIQALTQSMKGVLPRVGVPQGAISIPDLKINMESGQFIPYTIVGGSNGLDMTDARSDEEFIITGTSLVAATDGDLDGVFIRFNTLEANQVPIKYFNPWVQPFFRIYLTHGAQPGATLLLAVGKGDTQITTGVTFSNFIGQTAALYGLPEWAVHLGGLITFGANGGPKSWGETVTANKTVPSDQLYYIRTLTAGIRPWASADYDHQMNVAVDLEIGGLTWKFSGQGGFCHNFEVPLLATSGQTITATAYNRSNIDVGLMVSVHAFH